jgi:hypothetical protein
MRVRERDHVRAFRICRELRRKQATCFTTITAEITAIHT